MPRSIKPDLTIVDVAGPALQGGADARPGYAFAALRQKKSAVRGALNQSARAVEELIGYPFQRDAAVGATVDINVGVGTLTDHHQHHAVAGNPEAPGISELVEPTQRKGQQVIFIICHAPIISVRAGQRQRRHVGACP